MEATIHRCVPKIFLAKSLKNTCEIVQIQYTACIFTKNELFQGYFLGFAKVFSTLI